MYILYTLITVNATIVSVISRNDAIGKTTNMYFGDFASLLSNDSKSIFGSLTIELLLVFNL